MGNREGCQVSDKRLADLEFRLAFQEDALNSLDQVVARQQRDIEDLQRLNRELYRRLREWEERLEAGSEGAEEKPPHY